MVEIDPRKDHNFKIVYISVNHIGFDWLLCNDNL